MAEVMADRLRTALGRGEFRLVYQPLVSLADGAIDAFEALLRWTHRGAPVPLEVYIPVAEQTGLIHRLGDWVLRTACAQMHGLNRAHPGRAPIRAHVNVSGYQLDVDGWHRQVERALHEGGLPPEHLVLELTEGRGVGDDSRMRRQLTEVAMLGAEIAVDAFGSGYSTLAYLPQMPLHVIKVDRLFVQRLGDDPVAGALIRSLNRLTRDLRIRCIAEGVETPAQARVLADMGYTQAQGYLFSKPLEYEAVLADLPALEAATAGVANGLAKRTSPSVPVRVLVVDEHGPALAAVWRALERSAQLDVRVLDDLAKAVEVMHQNGPLDAVVIALAADPEPGIRLARAVRSTCRGRAIPVVAVARGLDLLGVGADARLFDHVIEGPADPETVSHGICRWVAGPRASDRAA